MTLVQDLMRIHPPPPDRKQPWASRLHRPFQYGLSSEAIPPSTSTHAPAPLPLREACGGARRRPAAGQTREQRWGASRGTRERAAEVDGASKCNGWTATTLQPCKMGTASAALGRRPPSKNQPFQLYDGFRRITPFGASSTHQGFSNSSEELHQALQAMNSPGGVIKSE